MITRTMATPARAYFAPRRPNQPIQPTAGRYEMTSSQHAYEVRPRKDKRGVNLISDALPFGRLWYGEPNAVSNAIGYAKLYSRSHRAVTRVYDESGNMIETHEHAGDFKEWWGLIRNALPPNPRERLCIPSTTTKSDRAKTNAASI